MAKTIVTIEGISDLLEALSELPKATSKNVLKRTLIKAGQPIAEDARSHARTLTGRLQRSFGVSSSLSQRQRSQNKKESEVEVYAGPGALVEAITEEFGTTHSAPHPTLRPAWDANKTSAFKSIRDDLAEEIEKARKRLARKAEREAAKMNKA